MPQSPAAAPNPVTGLPREPGASTWMNLLILLVWLLAGAVAFLPFALNTSPWDAVTLRVPGNQGNWWHFLAGAPFFLAFPMIWLRLRSLFSPGSSTVTAWRILWILIALSLLGTILVELPFLLHLAGTSEWQRFVVLGLGLGIVLASILLLILRRDRLFPTQACLAGLNAAWLANAALCLVVYAGAAGAPASRSGWFVSIVIFWPILLELAWLFRQSFRAPDRLPG